MAARALFEHFCTSRSVGRRPIDGLGHGCATATNNFSLSDRIATLFNGMMFEQFARKKRAAKRNNACA